MLLANTVVWTPVFPGQREIANIYVVDGVPRRHLCLER
jgi:hypothetical protein